MFLVFMSSAMTMALFIIFMLTTSPFLASLALIVFSCLSSLLLFMMFSLSWHSYFLFMIFLGGLMVVFIYSCAMVPNMFVFNFKNKMLVLNIMFIMFFTLMLNTFNSGMKFFYSNFSLSEVNVKMYFWNMNLLILMTFFVVLLTLFVCIVVSKKELGSLRVKKK